MSMETAKIMAHLAGEYVKANSPNRKVWNFSFPPDNGVANELRALGLIENFASRGPNGIPWRLTDAGQRWVMAHRT